MFTSPPNTPNNQREGDRFAPDWYFSPPATPRDVETGGTLRAAGGNAMSSTTACAIRSHTCVNSTTSRYLRAAWQVIERASDQARMYDTHVHASGLRHALARCASFHAEDTCKLAAPVPVLNCPQPVLKCDIHHTVSFCHVIDTLCIHCTLTAPNSRGGIVVPSIVGSIRGRSHHTFATFCRRATPSRPRVQIVRAADRRGHTIGELGIFVRHGASQLQPAAAGTIRGIAEG